MTQLPVVSIVTPSYNQAQFLEATICSVLEQDYPHIEYIIIDGGSTDGSVDIIRKYAERLAYWVSAKDAGQSDAINKGLARTTGQILGWLNSDDCYLPRCVSTIVECFEQYSDAGMIYGQVEIIDEHGRRTGRLSSRPYTFADQLTQRMIIPQPAAFWRREVMDTAGLLRQDLHYAMDFEYWIRIGRRYRIVGVPRTMAQYRVSKVNKGGAQAAKWGPEFLRILDDLYSQPNLQVQTRALERNAYAGAYYKGGCGFVQAYDLALGRAWLLKAANLDPMLLLVPDWWAVTLKCLCGLRVYRWGRNFKGWLRQYGVPI